MAAGGTVATPVTILSVGSLNTRAEPVSDPSPATICSHRGGAGPALGLAQPPSRQGAGAPGEAQIG